MQLRWSPASPFVRKVCVAAIELGLDAQIENIPTDYDDPASGLWNENPLGRVPALICDDGSVIAGSAVICAYLDALGGNRLIPADTSEKWAVLNGEAVADGLCEAAIAIQRELSRAEEFRLESWIDRQKGKVLRTIGWWDASPEKLDAPVSLDQIALGCTLSWMEFRLNDVFDGWRKTAPALSRWFEEFENSPSMQATRPK